MSRTPGNVILRARPRRPAQRSIGQSLAEFALTLPMALFIVLFGLDFGRVFLGWVALNNATREAANFAALNPTAWTDGDLIAQSEYTRLVTTETSDINCTLASVPAPSFPNGTGIGSPAVVALTCQFGLITPLLGNLLGSPIPVSASSAFPIRIGTILDVPVASALPTTSPEPSGTPAPTDSPAPGGSPAPTDTPTPTETPGPTAAPTATPVPLPSGICTVPNFHTKSTSVAVDLWTSAGFYAGNILFSPLVPPHYIIRSQSLAQNQNGPCSSTITVSGR
jgi:Flp pilus assembly protein TadG